MPTRPSPSIVRNSRSVRANVPIISMIQGYMERKRQEEAGKNMAELLGIAGRQLPQQTGPPVDVGDGFIGNMPTPIAREPDYTGLTKSEEGRNLMADLIRQKSAPKGAEAKPETLDLYDEAEKKTFTYQVDREGNLKKLGVAPPKAEKTGAYDPTDEVAAYVKKKYGMDALMEWIYNLKIASNPVAGMITPASTVLENIEKKYGGKKSPVSQKKAPKLLTPEIAADYMKRYKTRPEAEAAAKSDGYTW